MLIFEQCGGKYQKVKTLDEEEWVHTSVNCDESSGDNCDLGLETPAEEQ